MLRWEIYLQAPFALVTDHMAMKWLFSKNNASARLQRWALVIQSFAFDVLYKPGKIHIVPDILSREGTGSEPIKGIADAVKPDDRWGFRVSSFDWTGVRKSMPLLSPEELNNEDAKHIVAGAVPLAAAMCVQGSVDKSLRTPSDQIEYIHEFRTLKPSHPVNMLEGTYALSTTSKTETLEEALQSFPVLSVFTESSRITEFCTTVLYIFLTINILSSMEAQNITNSVFLKEVSDVATEAHDNVSIMALLQHFDNEPDNGQTGMDITSSGCGTSDKWDGSSQLKLAEGESIASVAELRAFTVSDDFPTRVSSDIIKERLKDLEIFSQ